MWACSVVAGVAETRCDRDRLEAYDAQRKLAKVSFQDVSMTVETQRMALGNLRLQIGSMYQFLGETYSSNQVTLQI